MKQTRVHMQVCFPVDVEITAEWDAEEQQATVIGWQVSTSGHPRELTEHMDDETAMALDEAVRKKLGL